MTTWDEVYAPLGAPRQPSAAPAPAGRSGSWKMIAAASVAAALMAATALALNRAPRRREPPVVKIERSAPAPARPLALRPGASPPIAEAPASLPPEMVEPEVKIVQRSQPTGGPLIIDVAEALAKLGRAAPATR